jgi:hypothetical protein
MIQNMTHAMWKTRNDAIHKMEDSAMNKKQHEDLDLNITNIFRDLPPKGAMPTCDAAFFFKRGADRIKRYRLTERTLGSRCYSEKGSFLLQPESNLGSLS